MYFTESFSSKDEKEVLRQLSEGNRQAFNRIYKHYYPRLYEYLFPFTGDSKSDTDEVLQTIFIKIWLKRNDLILLNSFGAYLFRMSRNQLHDLKRARLTQNKHESSFAASQAGDHWQNFTENEIAFREYYGLAQKAIGMLPARRKMIFRLSMEQNLSVEEISKQMNLSKAVVKKQLYKCTSFMKNFIKRQMEKGMLFLFLVASFLAGF